MKLENEIEEMVERFISRFTYVHYEMNVPLDILKRELCKAIMAIEYEEEEN